MLDIHIFNERQNEQFRHAGQLELGRGPQRGIPRFQLDDQYVSRDQLLLEELPGRRVRLQNLSSTRPVHLPDGSKIPAGRANTLLMPILLTVGKSQVNVAPAPATKPVAPPTVELAPPPVELAPPAEESLDLEAYQALPAPPPGDLRPLTAAAQGDPERLARWLQAVVALQQVAAGSTEFYKQVAQDLLSLIGLDLGLVFLRRQGEWTIAAAAAADSTVNMHFSRTLLNHVARERTTVYQDQLSMDPSIVSLNHVEAVVAAPICGVQGEVAGILYGARVKGTVARGGIQPAEAQLVQLLAGLAGGNLSRAEAARTRVQFEQFFSPELARELERDPKLLEGRSQEVTVLFSDLRGFTALSQRLGARNTCQMVRDMMERLSERIVEHGGVIVDYAGDGILAMWNAPTSQPDHAARACRAALAMLGELEGLNRKWYELAGGSLRLGIGIHTGLAQVGNTGSSRKFKYGPHGHAVNLASRIQDATKKLGLPVLISAATQALLPAELATRRVGKVMLPGVFEAAGLYELHGSAATPAWQARRDRYEAALREYEKGEWALACQTLAPLLSEFEEGTLDGPTLKLLRRAGECLEARPEPFDPILEVAGK